MYRARFYANLEDPRPINWPIEHPYWVTGETDKCSVIVAYADDEDYILKNWPEAEQIEMGEPVANYEFSGRFPKPDWFKW